METAKSAIRAQLHTILRATSAEERAAWSAEIRRSLTNAAIWKNVRTVMLFAATRYEPDLIPLLETDHGKRLLFPSLENEIIVPRAVRSADELIATPHGIREPDKVRCPAAASPEIDLILIPGLGFARDGTRIGRGRGHFDRFLAALPPHTVRCGVCFARQTADSIPSEPHDAPVTCLLTERGVVRVEGTDGNRALQL